VGVVWAVGAIQSSRSETDDEPSPRDGIPAPLAGAAVGVAALATPAALWRSVTIHQSWSEIAGVALLLPATAGAVWSRLALGSMWSSAPRVRREHSLRTTGPYSVTRHPIYTAILAMLVGTALTQGLGRYALLVVATTLILRRKAVAEERLLAREFPEQYASYRRRVPRLVPRLGPLGGDHGRA
jgi:protein-S-isoprenylcysteine O-methyltransferase Ste14